MGHEPYIKVIKEDMENMISSGQVPKDQIVLIALEKLASIGDNDINETIVEFLDKRDNILKQTSELNDKYIRLIDSCYKGIVEL